MFFVIKQVEKANFFEHYKRAGKYVAVIIKEFHLLGDRKSKDKWQADISLASFTYAPPEEK